MVEKFGLPVSGEDVKKEIESGVEEYKEEKDFKQKEKTQEEEKNTESARREMLLSYGVDCGIGQEGHIKALAVAAKTEGTTLYFSQQDKWVVLSENHFKELEKIDAVRRYYTHFKKDTLLKLLRETIVRNEMEKDDIIKKEFYYFEGLVNDYGTTYGQVRHTVWGVDFEDAARELEKYLSTQLKEGEDTLGDNWAIDARGKIPGDVARARLTEDNGDSDENPWGYDTDIYSQECKGGDIGSPLTDDQLKRVEAHLKEALGE